MIYYSLSYDAKGMTKSQIAARQADQDHIQGMLNVAFTRAKDEIHIFVSASLRDFTKASGQGTIRDWLEHCSVQCSSTVPDIDRQLGRADSEFEAHVMQALSEQGVTVTAQYPSCGFFIDIVAELDGSKLAVECDGELFHLDEHGMLRREDVERQEILERAGWKVTRIPYRQWRKHPSAEVARILGELGLPTAAEPVADDSEPRTAKAPKLTPFEAAVVVAVQEDNHARDDVLRTARASLGYQRLGPTVKARLNAAISSLAERRLLFVEDGELYLPQRVSDASVRVDYTRPVYKTPYDPSWSRKQSGGRRRHH